MYWMSGQPLPGKPCETSTTQRFPKGLSWYLGQNLRSRRPLRTTTGHLLPGARYYGEFRANNVPSVAKTVDINLFKEVKVWGFVNTSQLFSYIILRLNKGPGRYAVVPAFPPIWSRFLEP